jgi:hypothetical protein
MNEVMLQYLHRTSEFHFLFQRIKHVLEKLCLNILENIRGCHTEPGLVSFMRKKVELYTVSLLPKTQELLIQVKILKYSQESRMR